MNKQKNPAVTSRIKSFSKAGHLHAEFILEHCRFDQLLFEHSSKGTCWLHVSCKRKGNRQMFRPNVKA